MTPKYLASQIAWSRRNLGVETLDIYYLHNPEIQLSEVDRPEFIMRVRAAFELLEQEADAGRIGVYGVATWDGLRLPPEDPGHLSEGAARGRRAGRGPGSSIQGDPGSPQPDHG